MPYLKLVVFRVHELSTFVDDHEWDQLTPDERESMLSAYVHEWHQKRWPTSRPTLPPEFRWEVI